MRTVAAMFAALLIAFAGAQGGPGGPGGPPGGGTGGGSGPAIEPVSPFVHIQASIGGLTPGQYVSGTNVNFNHSFLAFSPIWETTPGPEDITNAVLSSFQVTVGGESVQTWNFPTPSSSGAPVAGGSVRFASNHFAPGTTITIKAKGTFLTQKKKNVGTQTYDGIAFVEKQITVDVYNNHVVFASPYNGLGQWEDPDLEDTSAWARSKAATDADGAFRSPTLKHNRLAASPPSYNLQFPQMGPAITGGTVLLAFCHGTSSGLIDSGNGSVPWNSTSSNPNSISSFIGNKGTIPGYNLVLAYACDTLTGSSPSAAPAAFGITSSTGQAIVDRGYAGFNKTILMYGLNPNGSVNYDAPISDHSTWLIGRLQAGETLAQAASQADSLFPAYALGSNNPIITEVRGDSMTRMRYVYGGPTNWYMSFL